MLNGTSSQNAPINLILNINDPAVVAAKNEYLIWWKGYPKDEATWTEEKLLPKKLVREFNAL
jgi:hypothetical protein